MATAQITRIDAPRAAALAATVCAPTECAPSSNLPKAYNKAELLATAKAACADRMSRFLTS